MAGTSFYDLVVPTFTKGLKTLDHILSQAEKYAKEQNIDANSTFPDARLIEDQLPLTFQVQNTTKAVQATIGRITGVEPVLYENNEKTFEDLHQRIHKALEFLKTIQPEDINNREDTLVEIPFGGATHKITAKSAFSNNGQSNLFFHIVTAYSILRAKGVPLGKADFLVNFLELGGN